MQADTAKSSSPAMPAPPMRTPVDLSAYPDLVVVYLGFRIAGWRSLKAIFGTGPKLSELQRNRRDGLLVHEWIVYGWNHIGMRQYWRDLESLETFTRADPHKAWWQGFSRDMRGAGFWHEAYRKSGGMEAIYLDMPKPIGLGVFAQAKAPTGPFMSTRERLAS